MEGLVGGPLYDIGEHDLMDVWDADFTATHDAMVSDCSSPSSSSSSSSVVSPSRSSPHSPNTASSNPSPSSHLPPFIWSTDPLVRNDKLLTDDGLITSAIKPEDAEGNAGPLALVGTGRGVVVPAVGAAGSDGDSLPQSPLSSNDMDSECYPYLSMSASAGAGAGGGGSALPSINLCPSPPPQPAAAAHSSVKQEPMDELTDVALEDDDEINPKLRMDDEGDSSDGSSYDLSIHCNSSSSSNSNALLPNGLNLGALTPVGYVIKQGKVMSRQQQQLLPSLKTVQIRRPMAPPPTVTSSPYHIGAQSLIRVSTATTSSTAAAIVLTTAKPGSGGGGGGGSVATTAIPVQSAAAAAGSRVVIPKINIKLDPHTGSLVSPSASPVPSLAPSAPPPLISRVTPAPPSSPQTKSQDQQKKSNSNIASKTPVSKQKSQHKVRVAAAGSGGGRQPITTPLISSQPKGSTGPLVLTEEEKRTLLSEGFAVPQRMPLTKQEEKSLKKIRRKIKNKISAQESRRKKKEYMDCLERKMDSLHDELVHFKGRCQALEAQNANLVLQLKQLQQQVKTFK